jgi:hypothetical protein
LVTTVATISTVLFITDISLDSMGKIYCVAGSSIITVLPTGQCTTIFSNDKGDIIQGISVDFTGIYFTTRSHLVRKIYFPVTWSTGNYFHYFLILFATHYRFPKQTKVEIRTVLMLALKNFNGSSKHPNSLFAQVPKDILLHIIQCMNTGVFL